jgi:hypothetical protein
MPILDRLTFDMSGRHRFAGGCSLDEGLSIGASEAKDERP